MRPHTVGDANTHAFSKFRGRRGPARSIGKDRGQASERLRLARTRGVDPLAVACRQRLNLAVEGERLGNAAEQMETDQARGLEVTRDRATFEKRLDLRSEAKGPSVIRGIERLDSIGIAGKKKPVRDVVPDGERIHAAQAMHHHRAVASK